ncbi:hypothetical protein PHAVU_005G050500 [Phaseolus vulgaris]|uniref:Peptidase A1 domain-containing protein n=1 Tax=Phaseolus vulgaris TaxID=3885 RepID=V7BTC6_PHAVU|nr:hypothetical protein PHAVU_005G050500g [Phaseolus vulgaris]ESW21199.1 hypothetical protein PHAVU_005G050500g [Phaseolus vulgaris]
MKPFVFFCLAFYSVSSLFSTEANESPSGFTVDLIHRDSPLSPFYNPSLTPSQRIINAALRSISRLNRVSNLLDQNNKLPQSVLIPHNGEYLMRFYIGTPPVERLAIAETGSDLIWVQCSPCASCFPQSTPLFQPLKSSTFMPTTCRSQPCTLLLPEQKGCGKSGECIYTYKYGDQYSFSEGLLSTETLRFDSQGGVQTVAFPNSFFGCGFYNNITVFPSYKLTGIMGLGAGPLSLVSQIGDQIGHKFSYCLLPLGSTSTSKLKFGNESIITGEGVVSTPMIIKPWLPTYYFLNLEAVTVAQKTVPTGSTDGNVIIDSGTLLTYLGESFYYNFAASLQESLAVELVQDVLSPLPFCFPYRDNFVFPEIAFQFTGARVSLKPANLFVMTEDRNTVCLMIAPSPVSGISIFGSFSQIDFQVEYDLEGKKVSFQPTDCSKV